MDTSAILTALAFDDPSVRDAIGHLEEGLKTRLFDESEIGEVAKRLVALAENDHWQTRRAVAHVLRYLRHDAVDELLTRLATDENAQVVKEAQRTRQHRIERSVVGMLPRTEMDERMQRALADLETKFDRRAREAVTRVSLTYTEYMVRALNHQVAAAMMPVGVSLEALEALLEGNDAALKWVRTARENLGQADTVLRMAREYVKREPPKYRPTLLRDVIDRTIETVKHAPLALSNGLHCSVSIEDGLVIEAVASLLQEAFVNVAMNAIEASANVRPIALHFSATRAKENVQVVVRDEGCGMPSKDCEVTIWRPFGSQKRGGTGLGLPLVKKIVEVDHRGKIKVTSRPGEGTTVFVLLPARQGF